MPGLKIRPSAPKIIPLTGIYADPTCITSETFIDIITDSKDCRIFFTTDDSIPDPLSITPGRGVTFQYKGRFTLKPGERTVKAIAFDKITSQVSKVSMKTFIVQKNSHLEEIEDDSNIYQSDVNYHQEDNDSLDSELDYYFSQTSKPKYQQESMRSEMFSPTLVDYGSDEENFFLSRKHDDYQELPPRRSIENNKYEPRIIWEGPYDENRSFIKTPRNNNNQPKLTSSNDLFNELDVIRSKYSKTSSMKSDQGSLLSESETPSLSTEVLLKSPKTYRISSSPSNPPANNDNDGLLSINPYTRQKQAPVSVLEPKHSNETPRQSKLTNKYNDNTKDTKLKSLKTNVIARSSSSSTKTRSNDKKSKEDDDDDNDDVKELSICGSSIASSVLYSTNNGKKISELAKNGIKKEDKNQQQKVLKGSKATMNFVNDSGTQINFWGVQNADKLMERLNLKTPASNSNSFSSLTKSKPNRSINRSIKQQQHNNHHNQIDEDTERLAIEEYSTEINSQTAEKSQMLTTSAQQEELFIEKEVCEEVQLPAFLRNIFGLNETTTTTTTTSSSNSKTNNNSNNYDDKIETDNSDNKYIKRRENKKNKNKNIIRQNYRQINVQCVQKKNLWEDESFPAQSSSLFHDNNNNTKDITWRRPIELSKTPKFIDDAGISRFDVNQGQLGDCWLLAAIANLTTQPYLFNRVIPCDQTFDNCMDSSQKTSRAGCCNSYYSGIFRFHFWQYGNWIEVCVDDKLPSRNNRLVYMRSKNSNEYWSALLEKAYAKLYGCYESLKGGQCAEAMIDFTGGIVERINLNKIPETELFYTMFRAVEHGSLLSCSIKASDVESEKKLPNGLICGHAYSITDVKQLESAEGDVQLIRIRNPWGTKHEWNGDWSDNSDQWNSIDSEKKAELGLIFEHDGESWMSFEDFKKEFYQLEICHWKMNNNNNNNTDTTTTTDNKVAWNVRNLKSAWKKNISAGGCRNNKTTFHTNPQFRVQIEDSDDDDDLATLIISLTQINSSHNKHNRKDNLTIGYEIFNAPQELGNVDSNFLYKHKPVATSQYINVRDVCQRHLLPPGEYIIIPTTYDMGEECEFLLRIYSEKPTEIKRADMPTVSTSPTEAKTGPLQAAVSRQAECEFSAFCKKETDVLDAFQLQELLNKSFSKRYKVKEFNLDLCKCLVALKDTDNSWTLNLTEFKELWTSLDAWKTNFDKFDQDKSGDLDITELRSILKSSGFSVNNTLYEEIVMRFSDKSGRLSFQQFALCLVKLQLAFELHHMKTEENSMSNVSLEQFINLVIAT